MTDYHPGPLRDYLHRIGAEVVNFRRAIIKIHRGPYYIEKVAITIRPDGSIHCSDKEYAPNDYEEKAIKAAVKDIEFPKTVTIKNTDSLVPLTKGLLYEFWDREKDEIIHVQERVEPEGKPKYFIPWSYISTGQWEKMEPDGGLPFFKPRTGDKGMKIMVHEGCKAAAAAQQIAQDPESKHPWKKELELYEHWGMIGGALAPHRTNYEDLHKAKPFEVVYVCDNDAAGGAMLQHFSKYWRGPLKGVRFTDVFKPGFDMADALPKTYYDDEGYFKGPALETLMEPATWATQKVQKGANGRPAIVIRPEFASEWVRSLNPDVLINLTWPNRMYPPKSFNNLVRPFSHVDDTSRLISADNNSKNDTLSFNPNRTSGIFTNDEGLRCINTYMPIPVVEREGDASIWEDFIKRFVVNAEDRHHLLKWMATLIHCPKVKMTWAVMLCSSTQGNGKSTLAEHVIGALVGKAYCSYPSEDELVDSQFNYWASKKRLAICHEFYGGISKRAYNKLKSVITDNTISIQEKFMPIYKIDNFVHLLCCSNDSNALGMSNVDRRWFFPRLTDEAPPKEFFSKMYTWLHHGPGLGIIALWLRKYLEKHGPVIAGEICPNSSLKDEILEDGLSRGLQIAADGLEKLEQEKAFTTDKMLQDTIKQQLYDGRNDKYLERLPTIRSLAQSKGWHIGKQARISSWGPVNHKARIITLDPQLAAMEPSAIERAGLNPKQPQVQL